MPRFLLLSCSAHYGLTALLLVVISLLAACGAKPEKPEMFSGPTMGTKYNISFYAGDSKTDAKALQTAIDERLNNINQQMSTWVKDSEISRFNQSKSTDWFAVSKEFAQVTKAALKISEMSKGAFDITVGPLINLWGFGANFSNNNPSDEALQQALKGIGYQKLAVRLDPPALQKTIPELNINLSAIAKGYAVDAISTLMSERGLGNHLVEIGGEIRANGKKPDGSDWKIAIEKPTAGERSIQQGLLLDSVGIATSGDYRNYFERDGKRYSHTINPETGRPITHSLASITVLHPESMMADGLATAIMVLGDEAGKMFIANHSLQAYMLSRDGDKFVSWHNLPEETLLIP